MIFYFGRIPMYRCKVVTVSDLLPKYNPEQFPATAGLSAESIFSLIEHRGIEQWDRNKAPLAKILGELIL